MRQGVLEQGGHDPVHHDNMVVKNVRRWEAIIVMPDELHDGDRAGKLDEAWRSSDDKVHRKPSVKGRDYPVEEYKCGSASDDGERDHQQPEGHDEYSEYSQGLEDAHVHCAYLAHHSSGGKLNWLCLGGVTNN